MPQKSHLETESRDARVKSLRGEVEVRAPDNHTYNGDRLEDGFFTIPVRADFDDGVIQTEVHITHLAPSILDRGNDKVDREDWMWAYRVLQRALLDFKKELKSIGFDTSELELDNPK